MKIIDTHAHLDFKDFDQDRSAVIAQLSEAGIAVINPATDEDSVARIDELTRKNPLVWGAVGLHPTDVTAEVITRLPDMLKDWGRRLDRNPKFVAIGEIGLDYYHQKDGASTQKAALRQMLTFAVERDLPVIFHCRDAYGDLVTLLEGYPGLRGVIHCFSGSLNQAERFIQLGLHLSFTANVTYPRNEELRTVLKALPVDRFMVETDSPFLSPEDQRGTRNDPRNVMRVVEAIARAQNETIESVALQTTQTAEKLFSINI